MADINLAKEILDVLQTYGDSVTEEVNAVGEQCAEGLKKELRQASPKRSGEYAKSWQKKTTKITAGGSKELTVHNAKHYQITHLLEKSHAGPYGRGVVAARPHIGALEEKWNEKFEEAVERVIKHES